MEVMFYIIAGKFNPSNDDFPVKTLITKDKFADKYAQDCTNLLDQQDIFKIIDKIEPAITNGIECVQPRKDVGFNGFVVDVVYPGYTLYFNKYGDVCASCTSLIVADVFTTAHTTIHDIYLYKALDGAMSRALKDAGISDKISWFDFDF